MNKTITFTIKIDPTKIRAGHQAHITGTGAHRDKRTKRNRTRANQTKQVIKEYAVK